MASTASCMPWSMVSALFDEVHEAIDFIVRNWPPISPAREIGEIGAGAGERVMAGRVTATKNAAVAFRQRRWDGVIWAAQLDVL